MGFIDKLTGQDIVPTGFNVKEFEAKLDKFIERTEALGTVEDMATLSEEVARLKKDKSALEIAAEKREEAFARKEREIEHKIGLEKKRMEQDAKAAEQNARLAVREESMTQEREQMAKQNEYIKERMEQELDSMRAMTQKVMDFIPKYQVDHRVRENISVPELEQPKE